MKEFSERIQRLRKEQALTQKELGEKLNVSESHIRKWESGTSFTSIPKLIQLAQVFNVSADYLVGLSSEKLKSKQKELSDYSTDALMKEVLRRWM